MIPSEKGRRRNPTGQAPPGWVAGELSRQLSPQAIGVERYLTIAKMSSRLFSNR